MAVSALHNYVNVIWLQDTIKNIPGDHLRVNEIVIMWSSFA